MNGSAVQCRRVEFDDIQGLVRFGYRHLAQARFLLLRVNNREAACSWLANAPLTSAAELESPPDTVLHVALTSEGLRALGAAEEIVQGFSAEFVAGMAGDYNRSSRLGDVGGNDPKFWDWGIGATLPHVMLMLYARPDRIDAWQQQISGEVAAGFEPLTCLGTEDLDLHEPFGFVDGISQPRLDWEGGRAVRDQELEDYTNLSCLGEFLLGYPNEYGLYTDRPLLDMAAAKGLPRAEDAPHKADLGRNGTYLVMRQLHQDVHGFWQYLDQQAGGRAELRQRWAETMVGRTMDGQPLVQPQGEANNFDYKLDPQGLRCPLGAHVRRANPRTGDMPPGTPGLFGWLCRLLGFDAEARQQDLVASTRFHRLLRRGRNYGQTITVEQALAGKSGDSDAGLHFICLNANIARQFEFVQGAWLVGTRFAGLHGEGGPLLGHREPAQDGTATDFFAIPQSDGPDRHLCGLPRFVTVKGGAYFFLPGIRALRYLVTAA